MLETHRMKLEDLRVFTAVAVAGPKILADSKLMVWSLI